MYSININIAYLDCMIVLNFTMNWLRVFLKKTNDSVYSHSKSLFHFWKIIFMNADQNKTERFFLLHTLFIVCWPHTHSPKPSINICCVIGNPGQPRPLSAMLTDKTSNWYLQKNFEKEVMIREGKFGKNIGGHSSLKKKYGTLS